MEDHPYKFMVDKILSKFRFAVLNVEIKITLWKINKLKEEMDLIVTNLKERIPPIVLNNFIQYQTNRYERLFTNIKNKNVRKFSTLEDRHNAICINTKDGFIKNYTSVNLPPEVKRVLGVGPKFSLPLTRKDINFPQIIKDVEICIENHSLDSTEKNLLRSQTINILTNYQNKLSNQEKDNRLLKDLEKTRDFIKKHPDIIISRADKGNSTVLINKSEYYDEMEKIFSDQQLYKMSSKDPTSSIQRQSNELITLISDWKGITEFKAKWMRSYTSVSPKAYGLRKTHKTQIQYRPVISNIGSPTYKLARYVHEILAPVCSTFYNSMRNSLNMQ